MGFWEGLGKAMESNEQQRNVENARSDRKAETDKADARYDSETAFRQTQWENTLSEQKRRRGLEDAALTQAEEDRAFARDTELFDRAGTNLYSGTSVAGGTPGGGTKTGSTPTGSTRQGLETSIATLKHLGADNSTLTDLAGHGGPALAAVLEGYNKAVETATNIGGVPKPDINDYIRDTTFLTVDGEVPTMELMMERMGKTEEQMLQPANGSSGPTWEDVFKSKYTIPTQVTPILPGGVPEGLDIAGITAVTGQIENATAPFLEQTIADNRAQMDSPDIPEKDKAALATRNIELSNALKALEGGNATKAFNELGPDAANLVMGFLANKPGAERSNFGPPYDAIIQSRTFDKKDGKSDVDIAKLASTGELKQGDWYFQDGVAKEYAGLPTFDTEAQASNWVLENPELAASAPFVVVGGILSYNDVPQTPKDSIADPMVAPTQGNLPSGLGGSNEAPVRSSPEELPFMPSDSYPDIQGVTNQTEFWARNPTKNDGKDQWNENAPNTPAPDSSPEMEQEEGRLLADMIMDESIPGEMKDAATEEFIMKYGVSAMRDVQNMLE